MTKTATRKINIVLCVYCFIMLAFINDTALSFNLTKDLAVSNVRINNSLVSHKSGACLDIFFSLRLTTLVSVLIFDSDGTIINEIRKDDKAFMGRNKASWNFKDGNSETIPDSVYHIRIEATDEAGNITIYDPLSQSGGRTLHPVLFNDHGRLSYVLDQDAWVRIRIGIPEGPLLRTLRDWEPQRAGEHRIDWDGMDDTGTVDVRGLKYSVDIQAFTMPENSIIVTGTGVSLAEYRLAQYGVVPGVDESGFGSRERAEFFSTVNSKRYAGDDDSIHPHYRMARTIDRAPEFQIRIDNPVEQAGQDSRSQDTDIPTVAGEVSLSLDLEALTGLILSNQRYEIIAYVDYEFFMEDEQGYHPYTFKFDSTTIPDGEHVFTFNVATLSDQVGSASIVVNVRNNE